MPLYSIFPDEKYRTPAFDEAQIHAFFGDDIHQQFNVNYNPRSYVENWKVIDVNFDDDGSGLEGALVPDISVHYGRLYLSFRAFEVMRELLGHDGEFLPIRVNGEDAYFFNPLRKAEDVDGLDTKRSIKNEWGDVENTAFHAKRVGVYNLFKSAFDNYGSVYCQEVVKTTAEDAGLKGVSFTRNLGCPYGAGIQQ